jgi:hypothetical protein
MKPSCSMPEFAATIRDEHCCDEDDVCCSDSSLLLCMTYYFNIGIIVLNTVVRKTCIVHYTFSLLLSTTFVLVETTNWFFSTSFY